MDIDTFGTSVIVPTYNRANLIGECLDSILGQTIRPEEIIVVDDGSTDNTSQVLRKFERWVRIIRQANAGVSAARNTGIRHAKSEWITFLDTDDIWLPERIEILKRDASRMPTAVTTHWADLRFTSQKYSIQLFELANRTFPKGKHTIIERALPMVISGTFPQSVAVRREAALGIGFDPSMRIAGDTYFFCCLALTSPWAATGDVVAEVRRREDDKVALRANSTRLESLHAELYFHDQLLDQPLLPSDRQMISRRKGWFYYRLAEEKLRSGSPDWKVDLRKYLTFRGRDPKALLRYSAVRLLGLRGFDLLDRFRGGFSREQ